MSATSAAGPPRTMLLRYRSPSSPRSTARFATCSASSRSAQRLKRAVICSMAACGSILNTAVNPDETGVGERLQLRILLDAQAHAKAAQRIPKKLGIRLRVKLGEFGKAHGGSLAGFRVFTFRAGRIVLQDANGVGDFALLNQERHVRLDVARRNAPGFVGKQDGALAGLRHSRPKTAVQNLAVRFKENSRFRHFVFVRAEDLAKVFNLLIHAVEHLAHGVDFDFAALVTLERKTDGEVLGELDEYGFVGPAFRRLRGESGQRLPQRVLRPAWQFLDGFLERRGAGGFRKTGASPSKAGQGAQDGQNFVFARVRRHSGRSRESD